MYRHVFFDVDKTLTRSRSPIDERVASALASLLQYADVITVSGARESQIWYQLTDRFAHHVHILAQNGNYARDATSRELVWEEVLGEQMRADIFDHIERIKQAYPDWFSQLDHNDLVEDRGCQIGFSLYGHNASVKDKEQFDPDRSFRQHVLETVPFSSSYVDVTIGGTTTFDYFNRGSKKGDNVDRYIRHRGWSHADCIYIGDGLQSGGNDESVIGVCETVPVADQTEAPDAIRRILAS
jgi:HAD superfamily hydrolase (TIGR01484 family)